MIGGTCRLLRKARFCVDPRMIALVLRVFNVSPYSWDHSTSSVISLLISCMVSLMRLIGVHKYNWVSSAKMMVVSRQNWSLEKRVLITIMKRMGPKLVPCGTPDVVSSGSDGWPSSPIID